MHFNREIYRLEHHRCDDDVVAGESPLRFYSSLVAQVVVHSAMQQAWKSERP